MLGTKVHQNVRRITKDHEPVSELITNRRIFWRFPDFVACHDAATMTSSTPLHFPAAPTASVLPCPSFPGSVAGTNSLRSNFASLPQCLLQKVFARVLCEEKLVCETVCRAWRAAVSCMPIGSWGALAVKVSRASAGASGLRGVLFRECAQAGPAWTTVVLVESDLPFKEPGASFVNWLSQRAVGISCVILELATVQTGWLLPHLLLSLSKGGWQSPERPPIVLKTGDHALLRFPHSCRQLAGVVQSWSIVQRLQTADVQAPPVSIGNLTMLTCLTKLILLEAPHLGNLTELRVMPHLQSLDLLESQQLPQRAASFVNLQTLQLHRQSATLWDLSCCTRLTELSLSVPPHFQCMSLPLGDNVQLQVLKAFHSGSPRSGNKDFVLQHLASASKLTHLVFDATYPSNLRDGPWPSHMPHLHNISVESLHSALPEQWLSYPQLTYLDLMELQQAHLPTWFSNMTQLSTLHLYNSSISVFPDCLLSLSQLQTLTLSDTKIMAIPSEVTRIAHWPNLKCINLAKPGEYDLDSRMHLLDLYSRLICGHCDVHI